MNPTVSLPACQWYILYTLPNFEKKIEGQLLKKNIKCFLPLHTVVRQWSDRKKTFQAPLFPNYLFVYINNKERFDILKISGVCRYVTHCNKAVVLSEKEIEHIEKMIADNTIRVDMHPENGDYVRITEGPFCDMEGIVFKRKGKTRLGINISGFSQFISIELDSASLLKLGRAS